MHIECDTLIISSDCAQLGLKSETIDMSNIKHIIFEPRTTPFRILKNAFYMHKHLESIYISQWVTIIDTEAFSKCYHLRKIIFEERTNNIKLSFGYAAFFRCILIESVKLPFGVISISNFLFNGCRNLHTIIISQSIKLIDELAFYNCEHLTTIIYEDRPCNTELVIGSCAFSYSGIQILYIPKFVIGIKSKAFHLLNKLTHIYFEHANNALAFGNNVFGRCNNLIYIEMPRKLSCIGYDNFIGCHKLKYIIISAQFYKELPFRRFTFGTIPCIQYYESAHNYNRRKQFLNYVGIFAKKKSKYNAMALILKTPIIWRQICTHM